LKSNLSAFVTLAILTDVAKQRNQQGACRSVRRSDPSSWRASRKGLHESVQSGLRDRVLAGFKNIEATVHLSEGGLVVTPDEKNRRAKALRDLLARAPDKGKNDILITHKPNIIDALGKDWARVHMEDWPRIAAAVRLMELIRCVRSSSPPRCSL
jgi:hypothetical protein